MSDKYNVKQPSITTSLIFRESELNTAITRIKDDKLICILGPKGIGKSSFIQKILSHFKDRKQFLAGIILTKTSAKLLLKNIIRDIVLNIRKSINDAQKQWFIERCTDGEEMLQFLVDFFNQRGDLFDKAIS